MSFIAKNPLIAPEAESSPPTPNAGTRALFPGKDGWYDIDSNGNIKKIGSPDWDQNDSTKADYINNRPIYMQWELDENEIIRGFSPDNWIDNTLEPRVWLIPDNTYIAIVTVYLAGTAVYREVLSAEAYVSRYSKCTEIEFESSTSSMYITGAYGYSTNYQHWDIDFDTADLNFEYDRIDLKIQGTFNVLHVQQLDEKYIPDSIARVAQVEKLINQIMEQLKLVRKTTISLPASAWIDDADGCHQTVEVAGATAYSMVDLQPTAEQLAIFHEKDVAFVAENEGGVITVYCIGTKPLSDYVIQATVTEVAIDGEN